MKRGTDLGAMAVEQAGQKHRISNYCPLRSREKHTVPGLAPDYHLLGLAIIPAK